MMLLNCAVDLLRHDYAVLYLDSELNTRLFTARILAHLSGIEYKRLTAGSYSKEEEKRYSTPKSGSRQENLPTSIFPCSTNRAFIRL